MACLLPLPLPLSFSPNKCSNSIPSPSACFPFSILNSLSYCSANSSTLLAKSPAATISALANGLNKAANWSFMSGPAPFVTVLTKSCITLSVSFSIALAKATSLIPSIISSILELKASSCIAPFSIKPPSSSNSVEALFKEAIWSSRAIEESLIASLSRWSLVTFVVIP